MEEKMYQLNSILNRYTSEKVTLRQDEIEKAVRFWKPRLEDILQYVQNKDIRFAGMDVQFAGSYYERCKVGEPNEFDIMLVIKDLELNGEPYEDDGMRNPPRGFTRVRIDMGEEEIWRQNSCVNARGMLSAARVKSVFASLVRSAIKELKYDRFVEVSSHGPAVTLRLTNCSDGKSYYIDLVPTIKDKTWPEDANEWITRPRRGWPNQKLVRKICKDGCHLVAKGPKRSTVPESEKQFFWRYSFSEAEKTLFLNGGQGDASSCRKRVLRILKAWNKELHLHPLTSYHLKTMLFYECEANPHHTHWSVDRLGERFMGLLQRLENCLTERNCPHYFMRKWNLFETFSPQRCVELTRKILEKKESLRRLTNKRRLRQHQRQESKIFKRREDGFRSELFGKYGGYSQFDSRNIGRWNRKS